MQAGPAAPGPSPATPAGAGEARAGSGGGPGGPNGQRAPAPDWRDWLASPIGRYVLDWEQEQLDRMVADVFGYVALQCGMRELLSLRQNRALSRLTVTRSDDAAHYGADHRRPDLVIDTYEELPFTSDSIDLVVLPHVLEFADDPHQVLREVARVLRPEGRLIMTGFNPVSLWGLAQMLARLQGRSLMPAQGHFIALPRLRDWLKLLSFEAERGGYGCYRPPVRSARWLERTAFMEPAGDRWWPILGAVYALAAVKRVRGMRIIGPVWRQRGRRGRAPAVVTSSRVGQPRVSERIRR
ncbi:MAG: methyltransferase domain-containing protein [Burkholderiaceae bacterium]